MVRASIDIGSNSCLLLVAEVDSTKLKTLESHSRVTSLGKDLDRNKVFIEKSMDDTFLALSEYCEIIKSHNLNASEVIVTATEASRIATNAAEFFNKVNKELGLAITTISGEGEAYYTALGVCSGVTSNLKEAIIMDIGGASTELIKVDIRNFKIIDSISLGVGSVRATDWLVDDNFDTKLNELFVNNLEKYETNKLICVAGTMTTLSAMILGQVDFIEDEIQGHSFSSDELNNLSNSLEQMSVEEILKKYPLTGKRAQSIFGGSLVARRLAEKLNTLNFEISTYGLRYGVVKEGRINERFIEQR